MAVATFTRNHMGKSTYTCINCEKVTRETGQGESGCELCAKCFDEAGYENEHTDGGHECGSNPDYCPACRPGYTDWACDRTKEYHPRPNDEETTMTEKKPATKKTTTKAELEARKPAIKKAIKTAIAKNPDATVGDAVKELKAADKVEIDSDPSEVTTVGQMRKILRKQGVKVFVTSTIFMGGGTSFQIGRKQVKKMLIGLDSDRSIGSSDISANYDADTNSLYL